MRVPHQFDLSFNPKNALEKNDKIKLRHPLVNLKNVQVLAPPFLPRRMLFSVELWRQWQPPIIPPIQASYGALRSGKHERREGRGCRITKIQESLHGMRTQDVLLSE